ncbi:tRNA uracil 4-sulfurtransferase ThiI [Candidatus Neomarinimicrobiota bacterium]
MSIRTTSYILCHYSEIGLKGKNRSFFENKLIDNLRVTLERLNPNLVKSIDHPRGRIIIELNPDYEEFYSTIAPSLKCVFGLSYFAFATRTDSKIESIKAQLRKLMQNDIFETFRITARRSNSNYPHSSHRLNEILGEFVINEFDIKVNLNDPQINCYVDIVDNNAFIYTKRIYCSGGLPVGSSGKAIILLSGGIDSPVAAYYALKRGCKCIYVHFHSVPHVTEASIDKVRQIVSILSKYQRTSKLYLVEFAGLQDEIMLSCNPKYRVLHYRRYMIKIANAIAQREKVKVLYTGESLGQVASQTLENISVVEEASQIPVLRPLIGFDKQEIINIAKTIETYETSILPHEDCCTLYIPKHPATKARIDDVLLSEKNINDKDQIERIILTATIEKY